MLIGILCEVVTATSEGEKAKNSEARIRASMESLFKRMDVDGNGNISRQEFLEMKNDQEVVQALSELEVEEKHFEMYADLMFAEPEAGQPAPVMDMESTINMVMRLRPGSTVSALDFASFQNLLFQSSAVMKHQINSLDKMLAQYITYDEVDGEDGGANFEFNRDGDPSDLSTLLTLSHLEKFSNEEILSELRKRDPKGGSIHDLDPDGKSKADAAFLALCTPQHAENDREAWSKETYTC